ncbi:hypothetical protein [Aquimarina sp. 2201CG14-23]|uniref:hypothetical protein n=1 Tax=Aquimarina mycalae TaxID=3040073 RepID=UPI0024781356|nr:hypothetical protein [Aquimarina sp. 2201CG14-23]MDH7448473.1 hypothetical protein [Aquimarina sp. 2201CG14-23]
MINFVLDGHHKLKAYKELGIPPRVLSIILFSDINQTKNKNFDYSEILNTKQLNHLNEIQQKFPDSRMK